MKNERFLWVLGTVVDDILSILYSNKCYNGEITFANNGKIYYDNVETVASFEKFLYESSIVNINTDGIEKLMTLEGIGEKTAMSIISYRNENGKFETIEDIMDVKGIGEKTFENIKNYIVTE